MKKVSIIIPTYNCEQYIERCIISIVNQTYKNIEVIVINDGSKDKTLEILKKIQEKYKNIIIINKENTGVSNSRNIGLKKATGDYILFIDSDDWIENETVKELIEVINNYDVDIVRYSYMRNNMKEEIIYTKKDENNNDDGYALINKEMIRKVLIGKIEAYTPLILIKKEIALYNNFEEDIGYMEDLLYYVKLLVRANNIYFLNKPLYHYFNNPTSVSNNDNKYIKNIEDVKKVNKRVKELLKKYNIYDEQLKNEIDIIHFSIILEFVYLLYKNKKISKQEVINIIQQKEIYELLNNKEKINKEKFAKLCINAIRHKNNIMLISWFKIRNIISKIKNIKHISNKNK